MSTATLDVAWVCNCVHGCICGEPVPYVVTVDTVDTVAPSDKWWWVR